MRNGLQDADGSGPHIVHRHDRAHPLTGARRRSRRRYPTRARLPPSGKPWTRRKNSTPPFPARSSRCPRRSPLRRTTSPRSWALPGSWASRRTISRSFARTMIDLGNSTDIVADEAASVLAKFANNHWHEPERVRQPRRGAGGSGQQLRHHGIRHHDHEHEACSGGPSGGAFGSADPGLCGGAVLGGHRGGDGRFGLFKGAGQPGGGCGHGRAGAGGFRARVRHDGGGVQGAVGQRPGVGVSGVHRRAGWNGRGGRIGHRHAAGDRDQ